MSTKNNDMRSLEEMASTKTSMRRNIGFWGGVSTAGGIMIGSGIFYIGAYVLKYSGGNAGITVLAWILGGLLTLSAALCYAELGTTIPRSGGNYVFITRAFKKLGPILGYTVGWTYSLISIPGSNAALALVAANYIGTLLGGFTQLQAQLVAVGLILLFTALGLMGNKESTTFNGAMMFIKVTAILVITGSCFFFGNRGGDPISFAFTQEHNSILYCLVFGVVATLWCFDGWTSITEIAEEVKDPHKNISKIMGFTVIAITAFYLLFNLGVMKVMPIADIIGSKNFTYDVMNIIFGKGSAAVVTALILCSVLGSLNGCVMVYPRVIYAMARDHRFFSTFGKLTKKKRLPANAFIYLAIMTIIDIFAGSIQSLVDLVVLCNWLIHIFTVLSLIKLRVDHPELERKYKVPLYPLTPIFVIVSSAVMIVANFIWAPNTILGFLIPISGIPAYFLFKAYYEKHGFPKFDDELEESE